MRVLSVYVGTVLFGCLAFACGGDDEPAPSNTAGRSGSAGSSSGAGKSSSAGTAGSAGTAQGGSASGGGGGTGGEADDAGGSGGEGGAEPGVEFVSKPAGVQLLVDDAAKALGFTVRSSNVTQHPSGDKFYKEWFAEVYNGSDEPQCFIQVAADFQDAAGSSLLKLNTYAYGAGFDLGTLSLTATCAAPGETVPLWSNALDAQSVPIDSIKQLSVEIMAMARPNAVLHPSTPTLNQSTKALDPQLDWWTFSGGATSVADIYNVKLEFWGKSNGVVVGKSAAFHSENFLKGMSWTFETLAGIESETLDSTTSYFSFIDGPQGAARIVYRGESAKIAERRGAAIASWQAAEDRHTAVYGQP